MRGTEKVDGETRRREPRDHERRSARAKAQRVSRSRSRTPRSYRRSPAYSRRYLSGRRGRSRSVSRRRYSPQSYRRSARSQRRSLDVYRSRCSASKRSRSRSPRDRKADVLNEKRRMDDTCAKPRIMPATATIGSRLSFRRTAAQITPVAPSVTSDQERPTASRREETRRSSGDGAENDGADGMKQRHRKDDSKWRKEEERKRGREIEHTSRSKELASFGSSSRKNAETEARAGVDREDHGTGTIGCAESGEARGEPAGRLRHSQPAERASDNASPLGSICEGRQSYTAAEHSTSSGLTPRRRGREGEPAKGSIEHTVAGAAPPAGDTEPPGSPPSSAKSSAVSDEQKHIPSDQQCQSLNSADSRYDARASSPGGRNDCVEDSTSNGTFAVDGAVSDETSLDVTTFAGTKSADRDAENSVTTAAKAGRGATPASKEVALKVPEPECLIRERNGPIHASVGFFDIRSLDPNLVPRLPLARQRRVWYPDRLRHHRGLTHGRQVGLASMTFSRNAESHRLERAGPSRRVPAVAGADHFAPTSPLVFERQIGQLSCDIEDPAGLQKNRRVFLRESPLGQRNMPISVAAAQESQYGRHDMWQEAASTMWQRRQGLANDRIRSRKAESKWTHDMFEQVALEPEKNRRRFNLYAETLEMVE